jgi:hypothetical protein
MAKLGVKDLRRKKPISLEHFVPADEDQAHALKVAGQRVQLAEFSGDEKQLAEATAALRAAQDEVRKNGIVIKMTSVGRLRYQGIIDEHPPKAEAVAKAKAAGEDVPTWDAATFFPALLAEVADSDLTAEQWEAEVFQSDAWNDSELQEIREKALLVNEASRVGELGN